MIRVGGGAGDRGIGEGDGDRFVFVLSVRIKVAAVGLGQRLLVAFIFSVLVKSSTALTPATVPSR